MDDLEVHVIDGIKVSEEVGQSEPISIEFNAVGLLKVNLEAMTIEVVKFGFLNKDDPGKMKVLKKHESFNIDYKVIMA